MRNVPVDIIQKLKKNIQTFGQNSDPSLELIVSRPTMPLTGDKYLQVNAFKRDGYVQDISIDITNPRHGTKQAYLSFIETGSQNTSIGTGYILNSKAPANVKSYNWLEVARITGISALDICLPGTVRYLGTNRERAEVNTEDYPWVFWVDMTSRLYGAKLTSSGIGTAEILASPDEIEGGGPSGGVTKISAVQSTYNKNNEFNYGLICFYIRLGSIYYRQYANGSWGNEVAFNPNSVDENIPSSTTFTDIKAFRTADYRVGIQTTTSDGHMYEFFTQYMDFGTRNAEHIDISSVTSNPKLSYPSTENVSAGEEHISVENVSSLNIIKDVAFEGESDEHFGITNVVQSDTLIQVTTTDEGNVNSEHFSLTGISTSMELTNTDIHS